MVSNAEFDKEGALDRIDGDLELLNELVEIFLDEHKGQLAEMHRAIEKSDGVALSRAAHSIKSALGNLGGMAAHAAAFRLELAGKEGNFTEIPALCADLELEIKKFLSAVQSFLAEADGPARSQ